jgi:hypothetical protein
MMTEMSMVVLSHSLHLSARICDALPAFEIKQRPHLFRPAKVPAFRVKVMHSAFVPAVPHA